MDNVITSWLISHLHHSVIWKRLNVALNCIFFFRFATANVVSADLHVVHCMDVFLRSLGVQVYKVKQLLKLVLVSVEEWLMFNNWLVVFDAYSFGGYLSSKKSNQEKWFAVLYACL